MIPLVQVLAENASRFSSSGGLPFHPEREIELCRKSGVRIIPKGSPQYPALLACVPDAPEVLYVRGRLQDAGALALVGTRRPTAYGRRMARVLSQDAAQSGVVTVSGLARGIDTEVHQSSVAAGAVTWAVLGSGLSRVYPSENKKLADEIIDTGGAIVSEVPMEGAPVPANFPRRNRIISGLSWGTTVIEGDLKSGALITARAALEQGRDVFAVPGPVDSVMSSGPHRLLKDGARLVQEFSDILDELPQLRGAPGAAKQENREATAENPTAEQQAVLNLMGSETSSLEELLRRTGWDVECLAGILMELELKGWVVSSPGQRYAKQ